MNLALTSTSGEPISIPGPSSQVARMQVDSRGSDKWRGVTKAWVRLGNDPSAAAIVINEAAGAEQRHLFIDKADTGQTQHPASDIST